LAFQDQPSAAASLNDGNLEHCSSDCRRSESTGRAKRTFRVNA
jgi:hypothetical protein